MANQRGTFAKRNREMKLKDRAREKAERRTARNAENRETKGPEIAWDQPGGTENPAIADTEPATPPAVTTPPPDPTDADR
jgi:hypothetical protein